MGKTMCSQTSDNGVLRLILFFVIVEFYFHVFSVLENLVSIFFFRFSIFISFSLNVLTLCSFCFLLVEPNLSC